MRTMSPCTWTTPFLPWTPFILILSFLFWFTQQAGDAMSFISQMLNLRAGKCKAYAQGLRAGWSKAAITSPFPDSESRTPPTPCHSSTEYSYDETALLATRVISGGPRASNQLEELSPLHSFSLALRNGHIAKEQTSTQQREPWTIWKTMTELLRLSEEK